MEDEGLLLIFWSLPVAEHGYPVLVFSHGSLYGGSSAFLARHFASHGWVVAAPDHTGHLLDYGDSVTSLFIFVHTIFCSIGCTDVFGKHPHRCSGLVGI